ncbi:hypothetical protein GUITHDRAFT_57369, partial [Guillardia theta CCMP2712]
DLMRLYHLNEANILRGLALRFFKDQVYTYAGPILVAVNPWHELSIYDHQHSFRYNDAEEARKLPPHVFSLAEVAFRDMVGNLSPQSILVSGESGSGKTETCKYLMQQFAVLSSSHHDQVSPNSVHAIERQVLESNPILEAFGNAKTLRNDNSSRFGKFIELYFETSPQDIQGNSSSETTLASRCYLGGGAIFTYLLEVPRFVKVSHSERNYHFLYQLCAAAQQLEEGKQGQRGGRGSAAEFLTDPSVRASLCLGGGAGDFNLTAMGGCLQLEGMDDVEGFYRTMRAMSFIGISAGDQLGLLQTVAGLLHVSNIQLHAWKPNESPASSRSGAANYSGEDVARLQGEDASLSHAARLLQCDEDSLRQALCSRMVRAREETVKVPNTQEQALRSRDSLCKWIYGKLFLWLVDRVNETLLKEKRERKEGKEQNLQINILDIFGFEYFERNSFEQLCINYANERLQSYFNSTMIKVEQEEYEKEEIPWTHIDFNDNLLCVSLIESRSSGIIAILDEEGRVPRGSDEGFMRKVREISSPHLRLPITRDDVFIIQHYAGEVSYESCGFLEKNRDVLLPDIRELLRASSSSIILELFDTELRAGNERSGAITVASHFRRQLGNLVGLISKSRTHFIRCINPTEEKKPSKFEERHVREQLRCSGLIEATRLIRVSFPIR